MSLTPRQLIKQWLASSNQAPTTGGTWLEKPYSEQQTPPLGAVEQRQQVILPKEEQLGSLRVASKEQALLLETSGEEPGTKDDRSSETSKEEEPGTKDDPSSEAGKVEEAGIINNEPAAEQSPTAAPDQAATAAPPPPTSAPSRKVVPPAAPIFFLDPESGPLLLDELFDLQRAPIALCATPAAPERAAAAASFPMEPSAAAGPVDDVLPLALLQFMYG